MWLFRLQWLITKSTIILTVFLSSRSLVNFGLCSFGNSFCLSLSLKSLPAFLGIVMYPFVKRFFNFQFGGCKGMASHGGWPFLPMPILISFENPPHWGRLRNPKLRLGRSNTCSTDCFKCSHHTTKLLIPPTIESFFLSITSAFGNFL